MSSLRNVAIERDESAWEVHVRAECPSEVIERCRAEVLKELARTTHIPGFRPGKAPLARVSEVHGEAAVLERAVRRAIEEELPVLLARENILIADAPRVSVESLAAGKPVRFSARAPLLPLVELPDYKAIAREHKSAIQEVEVSEEEHREAMVHFRREQVRIANIEAGADPSRAYEESRALAEDALPPLDEAFVRSLGVESVERFREQVREGLKAQKVRMAREKRRLAILEDIVKRSTIKYPSLLREHELDDMEERLRRDMERAGTTLEAYFTQTKKTRDEMRDAWRDAADKRVKMLLVLSEIARKEGIEPDAARVEEELARARRLAHNASPDALRASITHALRNEKVLEWLEQQ